MGQLQLAIALASAAAGNGGVAWRHWDHAAEAADRLGPGYVHPWLLFGRGVVDTYAIQLDTDLCQLGSAVRRVEQVGVSAIPSHTRRAAALILAARAHYLRRETVATVQLLRWAVAESVETARHSTFARTALLELIEGRGPAVRDARELALVIGTLS